MTFDTGDLDAKFGFQASARWHGQTKFPRKLRAEVRSADSPAAPPAALAHMLLDSVRHVPSLHATQAEMIGVEEMVRRSLGELVVPGCS